MLIIEYDCNNCEMSNLVMRGSITCFLCGSSQIRINKILTEIELIINFNYFIDFNEIPFELQSETVNEINPLNEIAKTKFKYETISEINKQSFVDECSICLELTKTAEEMIILPCKHNFHKNCLNIWFNINDICPNCKLILS